MKIVSDFKNLPREFGNTRQTSVTIGNFDGFHLGHQSLWQHVCEGVKQLKGLSIAATFDPHPRAYFENREPDPSIFSLQQKQRAFEEAGCDYLIIQAFQQEFAMVSRDSFVKDYLAHLAGAGMVTVGKDFRFGKDRLGDTEFLKEELRLLGIEAVIPSDILYQGEKISSSRIRRCLREGAIEDATSMLGKAYCIEGSVVKGDQIGRQLGFPTANLSLRSPQLIPKSGVYLAEVWLGEPHQLPPILHKPPGSKPAVVNIGVRPTLTQAIPELRIEAYILNQDYGDALYGMSTAFYLTHRLRDELKFAGRDELGDQIRKDIDRARSILNA